MRIRSHCWKTGKTVIKTIAYVNKIKAVLQDGLNSDKQKSWHVWINIWENKIQH